MRILSDNIPSKTDFDEALAKLQDQSDKRFHITLVGFAATFISMVVLAVNIFIFH